MRIEPVVPTNIGAITASGVARNRKVCSPDGYDKETHTIRKFVGNPVHPARQQSDAADWFEDMFASLKMDCAAPVSLRNELRRVPT